MQPCKRTAGLVQVRYDDEVMLNIGAGIVGYQDDFLKKTGKNRLYPIQDCPPRNVDHGFVPAGKALAKATGKDDTGAVFRVHVGFSGKLR